jgi:hypothetical protein
MNVTELRDKLLDLLSDQLGTYTLKGDNLTPAIAIRSTGEPLPTDRTVTGLEVTILKAPSREPTALLDGVNRRLTWQIYLTQYAPAEGESEQVNSAQETIELAFINARFVGVALAKNKQIREQVSVRIPDITTFAEAS